MTRKSEWAEMRINGLLGWVHKVVMFITFPFRKFWQIISVLLLLLIVIIAIPMFYGVAFTDIIDWYKDKLPMSDVADIKDEAKTKIDAGMTSLKQKVKDIIPGDGAASEAQKADKENKPRFVTWNVAEFNRAKYEPKQKSGRKAVTGNDKETFSALKKDASERKAFQENNIATAENKMDNGNADEDALPEVGDLFSYYRVLKNRDLAYVSEPEVLYGFVDVVGPNNIYINNTYIYLYGIYSDPNVYDEAAAISYVQSLVNGRKVRCDVVAYTVQTQTATALCFVDNILINKAIVEQGYANNVALK